MRVKSRGTGCCQQKANPLSSILKSEGQSFWYNQTKFFKKRQLIILQVFSYFASWSILSTDPLWGTEARGVCADADIDAQTQTDNFQDALSHF